MRGARDKAAGGTGQGKAGLRVHRCKEPSSFKGHKSTEKPRKMAPALGKAGAPRWGVGGWASGRATRAVDTGASAPPPQQRGPCPGLAGRLRTPRGEALHVACGSPLKVGFSSAPRVRECLLLCEWSKHLQPGIPGSQHVGASTPVLRTQHYKEMLGHFTPDSAFPLKLLVFARRILYLWLFPPRSSKLKPSCQGTLPAPRGRCRSRWLHKTCPTNSLPAEAHPQGRFCPPGW